jgi:hypothetical protein
MDSQRIVTPAILPAPGRGPMGLKVLTISGFRHAPARKKMVFFDFLPDYHDWEQ